MSRDGMARAPTSPNSFMIYARRNRARQTMSCLRSRQIRRRHGARTGSSDLHPICKNFPHSPAREERAVCRFGLTDSAWHRIVQNGFDHVSTLDPPRGHRLLSADGDGRFPPSVPFHRRLMSHAQDQQAIPLGRHRPGDAHARPHCRLARLDLSALVLPRYRRAVPRAARGKARKFVAQSLQLRNDICNEPNWEAIFTDQEVNAWLAEDLVTHFADQLPSEVHEPRVALRGRPGHPGLPVRSGSAADSSSAVVARPHVPEGNVVELTLEKIRAGFLPVPADNVLDRIIEYARYHGIDVEWTRRGWLSRRTGPLYAESRRDDVKLEEVQIQNGQIRLAGRSNRTRGAFLRPTLPSRRVLQSKFPRRKIHEETPSESAPTWHNSTSPTS